jgi:hypothetical protein
MWGEDISWFGMDLSPNHVPLNGLEVIELLRPAPSVTRSYLKSYRRWMGNT